MTNHGSPPDSARPCKSARDQDPEQLVRIGPRPAPMPRLTQEQGQRDDGRDPAATRRDFLSLMGFTIAAAVPGGACRAPVQHAVPLPTASELLTPGVSNWYATTCGGCASACPLLVKQRDGRPIKIEGNPESTVFGGGVCATGQATVLSLYDDERLRGPLWRGRPSGWPQIDDQITQVLASARGDKRRIVLLSGTVTSPSMREIIGRWTERYPTRFVHVISDAMSFGALRAANAESFGRAFVPHYAFDRARVIVGFEADFLGTWLSPVEFARQYAHFRRADAAAPLHVQIESGMSVTGSNADRRIAVAPSELGVVALALLSRVAERAGATQPAARAAQTAQGAALDIKLDAIAESLWKHRGASLVVCGSNDLSTQVVMNSINLLLGNVGTTVNLATPSLQRQGDDAAMGELLAQMDRGEVHSLMIHGANPGYDHPEADRFLRALAGVPLSISFSDRIDETSSRVHAVCPDHHFLEAWGDAEPIVGHFSLAQPVIAPLFDTRGAPESLRAWLGDRTDSYASLRSFWQRTLYPRRKASEASQAFDEFWDRALQSGVVVLPVVDKDANRARTPAGHRSDGSDWKTAADRITDDAMTNRAAPGRDRVELHVYESVALRDGRHANNPWLQELPDPISKVTWGNVAAISPRLARRLGVVGGDVVSIKGDTRQLEIPVFVQPGQDPTTISIAVGYGRRQVGPVGNKVGANAFALKTSAGGLRQPSNFVVLAKTGRRDPLAETQSQFDMQGRPIVLETTRSELGRPAPASHAGGHHAGGASLPSLWKEKPKGAHSWGLAIDLNACTGCSACVVACQAENNVPVIGKDQVRRSRIMHWLRIDRYYSGPEDDPTSVHQPMMCQHCANAPCETVCPVLATTTSSDGLNQQVYNRCIGTRYCANNCPYKVRRFNWYDYSHTKEFTSNMESPLGRMVLNPDVTIRTRGVMEKCSLCVQRIQLAKTEAQQEQRPLADGDIRTACQQTCPTEAIVFGDLQDPGSRVAHLMRDGRAYQVLEELGTRPHVGYLKRLREEST